MKKLSDQKIIESWQKNAQPWVTAVREGEIESRLLVTNKAIVDAIMERRPETVLDIGCGEGWLTQTLCKAGIDALGIDAIPQLIKYAEQEGLGRYQTLSFEELSHTALDETFDLIVANFALLGNESVSHLFQQAPALLNKGGAFIVQTIHPEIGNGDEKYQDGWREGSWVGFSDQFRDPAPWYFRTLESWERLFLEHGFTLSEIREPLNPKTKTPASIIFTGLLAS